tara:strand:+ start:56 stop:397 length:342 start_codon:yes stop_codon:yes gene_type:complete
MQDRKDLERNEATIKKIKNPPNYSILNPEYKAATKTDEEIADTRIQKRVDKHKQKAKDTLDSNENKSYRHHEKQKKLLHKRRLRHGLSTLEQDQQQRLGNAIGSSMNIGGTAR